MLFNGSSGLLGNLVLKNGAEAVATAIDDQTITVESGTLTAASIVCDTLIIGAGFPTSRQRTPHGSGKHASRYRSLRASDEERNRFDS